MADISYDKHGKVRLITIRRADKMNSLDFAANDALIEIWRAFEADQDAVVALVLYQLVVVNYGEFATSDDAERVERQLCDQLPPAQWTAFSDSLILHGRRICKPTPRCEVCAISPYCRFAIDAASEASRGARSRSAAKRPPSPKAARGSSALRTGRR